MPSNRQAIKKILERVPQGFKGKIIDLGSGFGHLARALAHHCPGSQVVGYEISPLPWVFSCLYPHPAHLSFERKDFLKIEISDAQLIVCYLCPYSMKLLQKKFQTLCPGTAVISSTFALPTSAHYWKCHATDLYQTPIYEYRY